eukprot:CCRYP_000315-RB/>CCRYP_000315-RB protein AED:0.40 eAED:0.36 QI:0/0/0/1/0/0/2/0/250
MTIPSSLTPPVVQNHSTQNTSCHPQKKSATSLHLQVHGSSIPSSMSMSFPALNKLYGIFMLQQVFPPKQHGWQQFGAGTATLGPSLVLPTYTSTFLSRKKLSRGTCVASAKVCNPLRQFFELHRTHPPSLSPHSLTRTYTSRPMTPATQSTPTKPFPHASGRGNRYQMILYHTDSNSICIEPTKNRTEGELILACTRALPCMQSCGLSPRRQVLDNKASTAYKQAILDSGMTYQLVPPDDHRRYVSKEAI